LTNPADILDSIDLEDLAKMSEEEVRDFARRLDKILDEPEAEGERPETDDELHAWVLKATGVNIPRVPATPDTNAPFEWFADLFFEREDAVLVVASRGSGKSYLSALFNFTMCYWFPEADCMSIGAIEEQAKNVYNHVRGFQDIAAERLKIQIVKPRQDQQSFTKYFNNSRYKIVTSSKRCSPPDELILTTQGYVPIGELDPEIHQLASYDRNTNAMTWGLSGAKNGYGSKSSKYKGVTYISDRNKPWRAIGRNNSNNIYLGSFEFEDEAGAAVEEFYNNPIKNKFEFEIDNWDYTGDLITIETNESKTRVTPNHTVLARFSDNFFNDKFIVYLMNRGDWWRIGKTNSGYRPYKSGGLYSRMAKEKAERGWILGVFETEREALDYEVICQAKYGISGLTFEPRHWNQELERKRIHDLHDRLIPIHSENINNLFEETGLLESGPLYRKVNGRGTSNVNIFDTAAANLPVLDGYIEIPVTTENFENIGKVQSPNLLKGKISKESYEGKVYSINIEPYEYYISGRNVVHNSVNGPHDPIVHRDEVELMDREIYLESLNIEKAKVNSKGELIKTRTLLTSTRKTSAGLMQEIIDECNKAIEEGRKPPFKIYWTNVFDVMENQAPNERTGLWCRSAFPDKPEEEKCQCNNIVSGEWEEGKPRTFEDACGGKLAVADGFSPIEDSWNIFMRSPRFLWEAQQENKRPYVEDVSIPELSETRHGIRDYEPHPDNGPIYCAIDFGGGHPFGISYIQVLDHEIECKNYAGVTIRVKEGTKVLFDEIYEGEIGNEGASKLIKAKENYYASKYPGWQVSGRFGDLAAKAARIDFGKWGLPCTWPAVTRDREEHMKRLKEAVQNDMFRYDVEKTKNFEEQISVWHIAGKKVFDDMVDSVLYNSSNIYAIEQNGAENNAIPYSKERSYNPRQGDPFRDRIGISVKTNEIGGMSAQGWLDATRRR